MGESSDLYLEREPTMIEPVLVVPEETEVSAKATRRRFSAKDKLRILKLADACTQAANWARCCVGKASTRRALRVGGGLATRAS